MPNDLSENDFLNNYISYQNQFMWFLGAGTSRTAGLPTATDLIWDLKIKYYCLQENQNIDLHDAKNEVIRNKVQQYMDSRGFPTLWDPTEYSFYFELLFGNDYERQQKYLIHQLSDSKVSLSVGHRALAGLIALNKARLVFTTNFDGVIERAYAAISGLSIPTFHLEGSYAALAALNQEEFPIYAKIHGDFRYKSIKNLSKDLQFNDEEIQKCFIAASTRFGAIVSGYSGRDENVMQMFQTAIRQNNAFPFGLYWLATSLKDIAPSVTKLIEDAQNIGVKAYIVEVGTFDSILSKIWNQTSNRTEEINAKVRTALTAKVDIPFGVKGKAFPILRTNALQITAVPTRCALIETATPKTYLEIKELLIKNKPDAIITRADYVVAFGAKEQVEKGLGKELISSIKSFEILDPAKLIADNKVYHSFYERAIATAICRNKPLRLHGDRTGFIISVNHFRASELIFGPLRESVKDRFATTSHLTGTVPGNSSAKWEEALHVKIEARGGALFLMIRPTIHISPIEMRKDCRDFLRSKVLKRWNENTHNILNAWIGIILGGIRDEASLELFEGSEFPVTFKINPRTAYSQK